MNSKKAFAAAFVVMLVAVLCVTAASRRTAAAGPAVAPAQEQAEGAKHEITAVDLKKRLDKNESTIILDSRGTVSGQTIKGAQHVPTSEVDGWAKSVAKTSFIVTFCTCPHDEAAEASVAKLRGLGFKNAFSLKGGLNAAIQAGIPTENVSE